MKQTWKCNACTGVHGYGCVLTVDYNSEGSFGLPKCCPLFTGFADPEWKISGDVDPHRSEFADVLRGLRARGVITDADIERVMHGPLAAVCQQPKFCVETYTCDICGARHASGDPWWTCAVCDRCVCEECSSKYPVAVVGHEIELFVCKACAPF